MVRKWVDPFGHQSSRDFLVVIPYGWSGWGHLDMILKKVFVLSSLD
jgi:hypothetical protein